ncbi:MAG: hypothetical protein D6689_17480 [Deltaproteobacteria bacterium]|nr:MAG: hypothetical protein D6689_17480 [Deltaproteobacteria bacterium]
MATGILIERAGGSRRVEPDRAARSARALHVPSRPNPGFDPFDLMLPRRRAANPDDAPPPDEFAHKVADEMCAKLADCADADPSIEILCRTVASALPSGDVAAKVADGTCRYNEASAAACLDALASFDCDAPQRGPLDPFGAMLSVDAIFSCVDALRCVGP